MSEGREESTYKKFRWKDGDGVGEKIEGKKWGRLDQNTHS